MACSYSIWVTKAAKTIDGWENVPAWDTDTVQSARSTVVALSWGEAVITGVVGVAILAIQCCDSRSSASNRKAQWVGDDRV